MPASPRPSVWRPGNALLVVALFAMAIQLRPAATSVGPVLAEMKSDLGFGGAFAGVLTALPGFGFAVFGIFAAGVGARIGLSRALTGALGLVAVGLLARAFTSDPLVFLILSLLAIAGMAVGNVLVPPFIKANFGLHTARMTGLYTVALAVGATLPAAIAGWLVTLPGGWRTSLGVWGATAALALVPWVALLWWDRRAERSGSGDPVVDPAVSGEVPLVTPPVASVRLGQLLRSRTAVALAVYFGTQSMHAYVLFGWMAQAYRDGGLGAAEAGLMTAILLGLGIPMGFLMPWVVARVSDLRPVLVALAICGFTGFLGLLYLPTTMPWVWAVLLGISGGSFPTAITLITTRTRDYRVTMQVSAFVQSVGYLVAGLGPLLVGVAIEAFGSWHVPLWALAASTLVLLAAGIMATTGPMVDDDL
ncbi:MAG: MFS transporter [bacterium]|nr:MFS transporter [bacterium]